MLVLGWHGEARSGEPYRLPDDHSSHDAAAAIVRDGVVIAAVEEERLDRIKHSKRFPARAIRFCLERAGATLADVDAIVVDQAESAFDRGLLAWAVRDAQVPVLTARACVARAFEREFGVDVSDRIRFCGHHVAHVHAAWRGSGFSDALAVSLDGDGDGVSGLIARCASGRLEVLRQMPASQSLGNFYASAIGIVGYRRFDEYKVMGLAPYGDPSVYAALFEAMYTLLPDGRFELNPALVAGAQLLPPRRAGEPFLQSHKDFAAALQVTLERIAMHVIEHFRHASGARHLVLTGGVAHNCTMNGKILAQRRFDAVYVPPAAHDAGNAIGAALSVLEGPHPAAGTSSWPDALLGPDIGTANDVGRRAAAWAPLVTARRLDDAAATAARLIADGAVIGWVQGRSEFGPRALGNRSILADPRPAAHRETINAMVKKREAYRPFAPAVIESRLHDFFDVPQTSASLAFMSAVVHVRPSERSRLAAVTHIDGTARVQCVAAAENPRFHALIEQFGRLTGVPVVLNTSFNNDAEPIVDSVDDAIGCYLTTGIHSLIVGDWLVEKTADVPPALLDAVAAVADLRTLVYTSSSQGAACAIESGVPSAFAAPRVAVSQPVFRILAEAGDDTIRTRCQRLGIAADQWGGICDELFTLWQRRAIRVMPAPRGHEAVLDDGAGVYGRHVA